MNICIELNGIDPATKQSRIVSPTLDTDSDDVDLPQPSLQSTCSSGNTTDSGYATQVPTPDKLKSTSGDHDSGYLLPSKKRFFQRKVRLKPFDVVVPCNVKDRFRDVVHLVDKPLYDHLWKEGVHPGPISITLKYLGEDEARARPWIVVLCEKRLSTRVRQWFNTEAVKSHYSPGRAVSEVKFDLLVQERPPRLLSAVVYGTNTGYQNWSTPGLTLCGRTIRVDNPTNGRLATLGGLLKISWASEVAFYGVTVDHAFDDILVTWETVPTVLKTHSSDYTPTTDDNDSSATRSDDNCKTSDNESDDLSDDDCDLDEAFELDFEVTDAVIVDDDNIKFLNVVKHSLPWTRVGSSCDKFPGQNYGTFWEHFSSTASAHNVHKAPTGGLDWRLIHVDDATKYWTNRLCTSDFRLTLSIGTARGCESGLGKNVLISSGISGVKAGRISATPSFISLRPGFPLSEAYSLTITDKTSKYTLDLSSYETDKILVLQPGDCGSWVMDQDSGEVYGYVVGADDFQTTYISPFGDMLDDIRRSLGAVSITLPTHEDLKTYWKTLPRKEEYSLNSPKDNESIESPPSTVGSHFSENTDEYSGFAGTPMQDFNSSFSASVDLTLDFEAEFYGQKGCNETHTPDYINIDSGYSSKNPSYQCSPNFGPPMPIMRRRSVNRTLLERMGAKLHIT